MMAKKALSVVYMLPGAGAMLYWLARHPAANEAPGITAATFGGLAVLVLTSAVVLPAIMRRFGERARADRWQRAAISGIGLPVIMTFLWSILFLPIEPGVRVVVGLSGAMLTVVAIVWGNRRWPHLGLLG